MLFMMTMLMMMMLMAHDAETDVDADDDDKYDADDHDEITDGHDDDDGDDDHDDERIAADHDGRGRIGPYVEDRDAKSINKHWVCSMWGPDVLVFASHDESGYRGDYEPTVVCLQEVKSQNAWRLSVVRYRPMYR